MLIHPIVNSATLLVGAFVVTRCVSTKPLAALDQPKYDRERRFPKARGGDE